MQIGLVIVQHHDVFVVRQLGLCELGNSAQDEVRYPIYGSQTNLAFALRS